MAIVLETKKGIQIIDASQWTIEELTQFINSQNAIILEYIHN